MCVSIKSGQRYPEGPGRSEQLERIDPRHKAASDQTEVFPKTKWK